MTRSQVRDVLGSPLLTDIFHADRWDYIFTIRRQGAEPQRRSVVVRFDGDALKSIDAGDELPTEREFVASISTAKPGRGAEARAEREPSAARCRCRQRPPRREAASAPLGAVRDVPAARAAMSVDGARRCASRSPAPPAAWAAC